MRCCKRVSAFVVVLLALVLATAVPVRASDAVPTEQTTTAPLPLDGLGPEPHSPAPNSGEPGSTCAPARLGATYTKPGPGVTTTGLGADAPAYYEIGRPTGAFLGKTPKGVMLVIHGGGWFIVGRDSVSNVRAYADTWRARGWQTVNIDYRACGSSISDVFWFMTRIRAIRPTIPICAAGISAGGHLALLLATIRSDVACVVALAGPSDLPALAWEQPKLYNLAVAAFGSLTTWAASPARYPATLRARVLLVSGEGDRAVPPDQNDRYAAAVHQVQPNAYVDVHRLAYGNVAFVHTGISSDAAREWRAAENRLVAPVARVA